jgi:hypothetical protein
LRVELKLAGSNTPGHAGYVYLNNASNQACSPINLDNLWNLQVAFKPIMGLDTIPSTSHPSGVRRIHFYARESWISGETFRGPTANSSLKELKFGDLTSGEKADLHLLVQCSAGAFCVEILRVRLVFACRILLKILF